MVGETLPSQMVEHPLPSQVSLVLQPAVLALVVIIRLPARIVIVAAVRPTLRPTLVVRGPSLRYCFLGLPLCRPTLLMKMQGLLRARLRRPLRLLGQVQVASSPFHAWLGPKARRRSLSVEEATELTPELLELRTASIRGGEVVASCADTAGAAGADGASLFAGGTTASFPEVSVLLELFNE